MLEEGLSYSETERRFDLPTKRLAAWERIYLEDGWKGLPSNAEGAVEPSITGSCQRQLKKICLPRYSAFVLRMNT